jgi:TolA-binding protein
MGEGIVGKGLHNHKLNVKVPMAPAGMILLAVLFLWVPDAAASSQEVELFDKAYEHYLAYQPDMAVDAFSRFLSEFPLSSAKDAALFWLGESLIHVKSFDEARKAFSGLKEEFPESPFVPYVDRELGNLGNTPSPKEAGASGEAAKNKVTRDSRHSDGEVKMRLMEQQLAKAVEERKNIGVLLEEEQKRTAAMKAKMTELEKRETEDRVLLAKGEDERKRIASQMENERAQLQAAREKLDMERQRVMQAPRKESPAEEAGVPPAGYQAPAVMIKGKKYTTVQVIDFMLSSSSTMVKAGIWDVPWRNGNLFDDFVHEQILYDEAVSMKLNADEGTVKNLAGKFKLSRDEAEYLGRYLSICGLIDRKIKAIPAERVVESLTVHYTESDQQGKVALAGELQGQAKGGKTFAEIAAAFPDKVQFSVIGFQELQGWIKDRIELLGDGEVSVVWTKDGYMILKPVMKQLSYRPFEDLRSGRKSEIDAFVKTWLDALKKEIKEIEIVRGR